MQNKEKIGIPSNLWTITDRNYKNQPFFVRHNVLNQEEMYSLNKALESYKRLQQDATTERSLKSQYNSGEMFDYRRTKVSFLDYTDNNLEWFYRKITDIVDHANYSNYKFNLTAIESLQLGIYKSEDKGEYKLHQDDYITRNASNFVRKLSFSFLLTEPEKDFKGGDLEFYTAEPPQKPSIAKNSIILFPSFIPHKVTPVTYGERRSIVGWVNGPNWV